MKLKIVLMSILCLGLMLSPMAWAADEAAPEGPPYKVGMVVKTSLPAVNSEGAKVDLLKEGQAGNKKLIVFMNTACSACKEELDLLKKTLAGKQGVSLFVVATDFGTFDRIAAFQTSGRYPGEWYQDTDFATPDAFGFAFTPATVILDKDNKVVFSKGGYNKRVASKFEADLKKHL